jgi:hypothetical protein
VGHPLTRGTRPNEEEDKEEERRKKGEKYEG